MDFLTSALFSVSLKFYFDFAGYSFMAYGFALAAGMRISQNFNQPFLANNVVIFWRSWHMSLGRFLTRYVLEPNLSAFRGRTPKLAFASSIFLVSAMWHGGTVNYLLWGLFHGLCYFGFGHFFKRMNVPRWLGLAFMLLFFVFGRMLAIDADGGRLLSRLAHFLNPLAYIESTGPEFYVSQFFSPAEFRALILAAVFLMVEVQSARHRRTRKDYHLMRRPIFALILSIIFILFAQNSGSLLYARI